MIARRGIVVSAADFEIREWVVPIYGTPVFPHCRSRREVSNARGIFAENGDTQARCARTNNVIEKVMHLRYSTRRKTTRLVIYESPRVEDGRPVSAPASVQFLVLTLPTSIGLVPLPHLPPSSCPFPNGSCRARKVMYSLADNEDNHIGNAKSAK